MNKQNVRGYALLGIAFVLLSVLVFALPMEKTATFYLAYAFTAVAFGAQIVIWKLALGREESLKSKFLGFPIVHIALVYLLVQSIACLVFTLLSTLPLWSAALVCVFIAGISALSMITADVARSEVERVETKVQKKVFYIRELQVEAELLSERETEPEVKVALAVLAEKIRFSDPMSSAQLSELESRIAAKMEELKTSQNKLPLITDLVALLDERNRKCKILK